MARVPDILYQGQPGTTNTDLYTVPTGYKATITGILASNTNAATKYFSLYCVQNADSVADDIIIAKTQKLIGTDSDIGGGVWMFEFPIPLNTVGDKIVGIQETANSITITIIGFIEAI